jgi:hypothetical protein
MPKLRVDNSVKWRMSVNSGTSGSRGGSDRRSSSGTSAAGRPS